MTDAQQSGSQAGYPAAGISTVYVVGWPGEAQVAHHDDPSDQIRAYTEVNGQMLGFQPAGLGILRLNAHNEHQPGSNLLLTVSVPHGSNIDVQERNY